MAPSKISDAEWQKHKATISDLWIRKNMTLKMLMHEMSSLHSFSATKYQYTTKLKAWELLKNKKGDFWKAIGSGLKRRHLEVSKADVYSKDNHIPLKKLKKELPRYTARERQAFNDSPTPATPEGITIQSMLEEDRSEECSTPRSLTVSLPWYSLVDTWGIMANSPTLSRVCLPTASPLQLCSPYWASLLSQPYDFDFPRGMFSPVVWGSFEPPLFTGMNFEDFELENNEVINSAPLQNNVTKFFEIKATQADNDDPLALERHLGAFVIERQPQDTRRAVQELMDPCSMVSMQILTSYMALLFSNDLAMDWTVQDFLAKAKEMHWLGSLRPLFVQRSSSAMAIASRVLHAAIHIDATEFLSQALRDGADLESPSTGSENLTLLQKALMLGKDKTARSLIDAGANVNAGVSARNNEEACPDSGYPRVCFVFGCETIGVNSPLALAARSSVGVNFIPELFWKGAIMPERHPVLLHAIEMKASAEIVSCIINAGADVNQCALKTFWGWSTPLCVAAEQSNVQIVQLLLDAGADPNGPLNSGNSRMFTQYGDLDHNFESPLLSALRGRDSHENELRDVLRLLLECGANPNISALDIILETRPWLGSEKIFDLYQQFDTGNPFLVYPLQEAVRLDDIKLVKLLLQHKASVNPRYGTPPLAIAVSRSNIEIIRLLLSHNAAPNGNGNQDYCRSALEEATVTENLELIDLLLDFGADINKCLASQGGRTPLQRAAECGKQPVIEHLLKHGASMLSPPAPTQGASVLQGFVQNRLHDYVSRALKAGANPNSCSGGVSSPLVAAVLNNDIVSLHLLLTADANVHEYAHGVPPDVGDEHTPDRHIDDFCFKKLSPLQWAAAMNYVEIARILCEAGANVNQPPYKSDGDMALHLAVRCENYAMVKFLVAQNAKVDEYSNANTPLIVAIDEKCDLILTLLLSNGADPSQPGFDDSKALETRCPLDQACHNVNIFAVRTLLQAGADSNQGCALRSVFDYSTILIRVSKEPIVKVLLEYKADVNSRHYDDHTALQMAIIQEEFDCAYRLIEAGARINEAASRGKRGRTALQAAVSVGSMDMVKYLISRQANVNAPAAAFDGVTALQAAAIKGYLGIAKILLEHNADIDAKASIKNGRTAIEGAAEFGRIDMVKFLLDNYQGSNSISQMRDNAYAAAKKGNQWYVMAFLTTHEHLGNAQP